MNSKAWLVLKNEFISVALRRSFLVVLFLVPFLYYGIMFLLSLSIPESPTSETISETFKEVLGQPTRPKSEGVVDQSGLIQSLPSNLEGTLTSYRDEKEANQALQSGEIDFYTLIPADYLKTGRLVKVFPKINPLENSFTSRQVDQAILYNLFKQDTSLYMRYSNPATITQEYLEKPPVTGSPDLQSMLTLYAVMILMLFSIYGSATVMLNSFSEEQKNYILEVLLTSVSPLQLLSGKIIALGLVGLLQILGWGAAFLLYGMANGSALDLPIEMHFSAQLLIWGAVFFIFGYGLYACLMAGLGALVPNLREANQFTMVVAAPLFIPYLFTMLFFRDPNGIWAILFSLFPLTSPLAMMARLSVTQVPLWQPLLACALLIGSIWLMIHSIARIFRAQVLLSGQKFSWSIFWRTLSGKT